MTTRWIDYMGCKGDKGYLVETTHNGRESWSLRERPLCTNQSGHPRLTGWCGETDNKSRTAHGAWEVLRTNKAGDRAQIKRLTGSELVAFLDADGLPRAHPA